MWEEKFKRKYGYRGKIDFSGKIQTIGDTLLLILIEDCLSWIEDINQV